MPSRRQRVPPPRSSAGWLAQSHTGAAYLTDILDPILLIATGIGLTSPTLMAATIAATHTTNPSRPALAPGYHLVFLTAAALALAIVAISAYHAPDLRIHP